MSSEENKKSIYDILGVPDQLAVNAVIIAALGNPDIIDRYSREFKNEYNKKPGGELGEIEAFQKVLNGLRNNLAGVVCNLPVVAEDGVDNNENLKNQMDLLRNIRNRMVNIKYTNDNVLESYKAEIKRMIEADEGLIPLKDSPDNRKHGKAAINLVRKFLDHESDPLIAESCQSMMSYKGNSDPEIGLNAVNGHEGDVTPPPSMRNLSRTSSPSR